MEKLSSLGNTDIGQTLKYIDAGNIFTQEDFESFPVRGKYRVEKLGIGFEISLTGRHKDDPYVRQAITVRPEDYMDPLWSFYTIDQEGLSWWVMDTDRLSLIEDHLKNLGIVFKDGVPSFAHETAVKEMSERSQHNLIARADGQPQVFADFLCEAVVESGKALKEAYKPSVFKP